MPGELKASQIIAMEMDSSVPFFEKVVGNRAYRKIKLEMGWMQYQVITAVGFHWRHIAVVDVIGGKAAKAERYFYSTRAPQVILPFETFGQGFMATVCKKRREFVVRKVLHG